MTQLTTQRGFSKAQLSDPEVASKLSGLIDYLNLFVDNASRIMRKGIGVSDNLDGEFRTYTVNSGVPIKIDAAKEPKAILVGKVVPASNPVTSLAWEMVGNQVQITPRLLDSPDINANFSLTLWIQYS